MEKKITTPVVKGLIISLVLIIYSLITYFTGQMQNKSLSYIQYLLLGAGLIWACISYANEKDNYVTFGGVFGHGFKTTALVSAVIAVYVFLAFKFLFPDMAEQAIEAARVEMEKNDKISEEDMEKGLGFTRNYLTPIVVASTLFGLMFFGTIFSLIGAAIAKKKPVNHFENTNVNTH